MRMCTAHWARLRGELTGLGLGGFIADTGEEVARRTMRGVVEGLSLDSFEPLMGAHMAILSNTVRMCGLYVLANDTDGSERCPICFLATEHRTHCRIEDCTVDYEAWISAAAAGQFEIYKKLAAAA